MRNQALEGSLGLALHLKETQANREAAGPGTQHQDPAGREVCA